MAPSPGECLPVRGIDHDAVTNSIAASDDHAMDGLVLRAHGCTGAAGGIARHCGSGAQPFSGSIRIASREGHRNPLAPRTYRQIGPARAARPTVRLLRSGKTRKGSPFPGIVYTLVSIR
jgi:hypothetical protein